MWREGFEAGIFPMHATSARKLLEIDTGAWAQCLLMLCAAPPPASRCAESCLIFRRHRLPLMAHNGSATGVSRLPLMRAKQTSKRVFVTCVPDAIRHQDLDSGQCGSVDRRNRRSPDFQKRMPDQKREKIDRAFKLDRQRLRCFGTTALEATLSGRNVAEECYCAPCRYHMDHSHDLLRVRNGPLDF